MKKTFFFYFLLFHNVFATEGPPQPQCITSITSTFTSIDIEWEINDDSGSQIEGFVLYHKREYGEWESEQLTAIENNYTLSNLWCGTRYQLYIVAWNKVGVGEASEMKTIRTQGLAPEMPSKQKLVEENVSWVGLDLSSWGDGGCPILYFFVEYKPANQQDWLLVSNNVKVHQKFVIFDLTPATKYVLRVTAHSSAGSTVAEYEFETKTITGE